MDKSFYLVQELKELPYWNKGFFISVFTGLSLLSFGLELCVDIVNHCYIEKNLKTALFWLSKVNGGLTLSLKDINSLHASSQASSTEVVSTVQSFKLW